MLCFLSLARASTLVVRNLIGGAVFHRLFVLLFLFYAVGSVAQGAEIWLVGHGEFDDNDNASNALLIENRTERKVIGDIKLYYELLFTNQDAIFLGPGLYYDVQLGKRVLFTPCFGTGYYNRGDDKDLGLSLQWRSGAELAIKMPRKWRVGFMYHHLSNWGFGSPNPGAESYLISLSKRF